MPGCQLFGQISLIKVFAYPITGNIGVDEVVDGAIRLVSLEIIFSPNSTDFLCKIKRIDLLSASPSLNRYIPDRDDTHYLEFKWQEDFPIVLNFLFFSKNC